MVFNDVEVERYARHLVLREVGGPGQQKLKAASALIVGAGGLGSPAALYLAAAGVGTLILVDPDDVDRSNRPTDTCSYGQAHGRAYSDTRPDPGIAPASSRRYRRRSGRSGRDLFPGVFR